MRKKEAIIKKEHLWVRGSHESSQEDNVTPTTTTNNNNDNNENNKNRSDASVSEIMFFYSVDEDCTV